MIKSWLILVILMVSVQLHAQETVMSEAERTQLMTQVKTLAESTESIHTKFTQYKHLDFLTNDIETKGRMIFQAPDKVRWEYNDPYNYVVIFSGTTMHIDDSGKKSTVDMGSSELFQQLNQLIVNSVKGDLFTDADFEQKFFNTPEWNKVVFVPMNAKIKDYIASFELLFHKDSGMVHEVKLIEPTGDYTRIVFSERVLNKAVDASAFRH